jgi:hypothetical protein
MRKISLETIELVRFNGENAGPFNVAEGISQIAEIKEGGMRMTEMRQCLRIHDAVAVAVTRNTDGVILEDVDWGYLTGRLATHPFPFACAGFDHFAALIENAPIYDPNI